MLQLRKAIGELGTCLQMSWMQRMSPKKKRFFLLLVAMASNLLAMASNLRAMASNLIASILLNEGFL